MRPTEQVLTAAISRLREHAYGVTIHAKAEELVDPRPLSFGSVYYALERLEEQGLISSRLADPGLERGGRRKRYYRLEALAERAPVSVHDLLHEATEELRKEAGRWSPNRPKPHPVRPK